jgi:hypothetical protein
VVAAVDAKVAVTGGGGGANWGGGGGVNPDIPLVVGERPPVASVAVPEAPTAGAMEGADAEC